MCTSFVQRTDSMIIAMNFDNNGMSFTVNTSSPDLFQVLVDGGRGKYPSFGINSSGTFANNLMVDSNGKGLYRRPSKKVTHMTKLVTDLLNETIPPTEIDSYLKNMEVVNTPDFSTHSMIVDKQGNVWVVEPGRGIICSPFEESPFYIMTNFSLCDFNGKLSCNRYITAQNMLQNAGSLTVEKAFTILEACGQSGEWNTDLSMVYSQKEHVVYYCLHSDFSRLQKFFLFKINSFHGRIPPVVPDCVPICCEKRLSHINSEIRLSKAVQ